MCGIVLCLKNSQGIVNQQIFQQAIEKYTLIKQSTHLISGLHCINRVVIYTLQ